MRALVVHDGNVTVFGDAEPEDSWEPDDALPMLLDNLARRLDLLEHASGDDDTRHVLVRRLADRVDAMTARRDTLTAAERTRLELLVIDLAHVRSRLANG